MSAFLLFCLPLRVTADERVGSREVDTECVREGDTGQEAEDKGGVREETGWIWEEVDADGAREVDRGGASESDAGSAPMFEGRTSVSVCVAGLSPILVAGSACPIHFWREEIVM